MISLWEAALSAQAELTPIWHSVSCLCKKCIDADMDYLNNRPMLLTWTKRPLFADECV